MLWEDARDIRDATTLGHPLFGVKAIFVARLLRLVHRHWPRQRRDQRRQRLRIEQCPRCPCHQQCSGLHLRCEGLQVVIGQRLADGRCGGWEGTEVVVELLQRVCLSFGGELSRAIEQRWGRDHMRRPRTQGGGDQG